MLPLPLVSIIIPCYNMEERIVSALRSCLGQSYPNLEIIVVDNNCTDRSILLTRQVAADSPHPIRIVHCSQQGPNPARNCGLHQAQGDYLQYLDADDELHPDKIASQVAALERNPDCDIAYGDWQWCFLSNHILHTELCFTSKPYKDILLSLLIDNWHPPHSYLLRRSITERFPSLALWNPQTSIGMDREYFTLAALVGCQFLYVPGASVRYYRWSPKQITQLYSTVSRAQNLKACFRNFQLHVQSNLIPPLQDLHWQLLHQNWQFWLPVPDTFSQKELGKVKEFQAYPRHHLGQQSMSPAEANILAQCVVSPQARTLEDHARYIVHGVWQTLLTQQPQDFSHPLTVASPEICRNLAQAIELPLDATQVGSDSFSQTVTVHSRLSLPQQMEFLQNFLPHAPVFGEHRLAVYRVLEHLRQQGNLQLASTDSA